MAKMVRCSLCGKEIKKAFFGGEDELLDVGDTMLTCCKECYDKYAKDQKLHAKRFGAKLRSYKLKNKKKKLTDNEIANMYAAYRQEGLQYEANEPSEDRMMIIGGSIKMTADGMFSAMEFSNDFLHSDVNIKEILKSAKKATKEQEIWFTKDDITKIEYVSTGMGEFNGLFQKVYSYTIRFNDESQITYRPGITRVGVIGKGFAFGYRKRAEKKLLEDLALFKMTIGSDLPIVRGTK